MFSFDVSVWCVCIGLVDLCKSSSVSFAFVFLSLSILVSKTPISENFPTDYYDT